MKDKNLDNLINKNSEYLKVLKSQRENKLKIKNEVVNKSIIKIKSPTYKNKKKSELQYFKKECILKLGLSGNSTNKEIATRIKIITRWKSGVSKKSAKNIIKRYGKIIAGGNSIALIGKNNKQNFYRTREWRELRYKALIKYGRRCLCCGSTPEKNKIILHVDHVKPRSKYPHLELDINNLQILCEDCNLGKSNKSNDDFRIKKEIELDEIMDSHMQSIKGEI